MKKSNCSSLKYQLAISSLYESEIGEFLIDARDRLHEYLKENNTHKGWNRDIELYLRVFDCLCLSGTDTKGEFMDMENISKIVHASKRQVRDCIRQLGEIPVLNELKRNLKERLAI